MSQLREYQDADERNPFARFYRKLNTKAALKVRTALSRIEAGNISALKSVGRGVHEAVIDFGPGYRVYLGLDGDTVVILLGGSSKTRQSEAIAAAQDAWKDYRARKRGAA